MMRSFFNAVTGLNAYRTWMDVTADNLANVNTIGYKGSRPIFQDAVSSVITGLNTVTNTMKSTTYGAGILVDSTQKLWTIGNFKQTGVNTDLALQGKGLFILEDPISKVRYYTRDGQFRISRDGYMVNVNGLKLLGFKVDERGKIVGTGLEEIRIQQQLSPKATNLINFLQPTNLNASAQVPVNPFDPIDPTSYNYKYTITIYDSLGMPYQADVFFRKSGT
ncbi:MAG: flagellar hook protein FlgE, partial [Aquificota bacterium]